MPGQNELVVCSVRHWRTEFELSFALVRHGERIKHFSTASKEGRS